MQTLPLKKQQPEKSTMWKKWLDKRDVTPGPNIGPVKWEKWRDGIPMSSKELDQGDFTMIDNRNMKTVYKGHYVRFWPNSLMINSGFEIKPKVVLAQYFAYVALARTGKKNNLEEGIDVTGIIEVIDLRKKTKNHSLLNCYTLLQSEPDDVITIFTLEGYTFTFKYTDKLKRLCDKEDINEHN